MRMRKDKIRLKFNRNYNGFIPILGRFWVSNDVLFELVDKINLSAFPVIKEMSMNKLLNRASDYEKWVCDREIYAYLESRNNALCYYCKVKDVMI